MKNRTIYDVLEKVMEDYSYSLKKTGNKVEITGSIYIDKLGITVTHDKIHCFVCGRTKEQEEYALELALKTFREELKNKVAEVIKNHAEELTDDEVMIEKLRGEIKELREALEETEAELKDAKEKISRLELERLGTQPLPYIPWTNPNPWSTGITWETHIGDQPDWLDKNSITCEHIEYTPQTTSLQDLDMKCLKHGNRKKNGGER